jgi:tetratricopeptide (TPR) repeat protein
MLGNFSAIANRMFLLGRFIIASLCSAALFGQTALLSEHFSVLSETKDDARSRRVLERLEELRAGLIEIHGAGWEPKQPIAVWLPGSIEELREFATRSDQSGLFQSGMRTSWIVVSPKTEFFLEVLSHEYLHAVLARVLPGLPWWLEEGLCEYYSTLRYTAQGIEVGRPPGRRWQEWQSLSGAAASNTSAAYAEAWAMVATLSYQPGFPGRWEKPSEVKIPKPRLFAGKKPVMQVTRSGNAVEMMAHWKESSDGAQEKFLEGSRLLDLGRVAEAIPLLEAAAGLRPSNSTWWHTLAFAYGEMGQSEKKKAAAERALAAAVNETERQQALSLVR